MSTSPYFMSTRRITRSANLKTKSDQEPKDGKTGLAAKIKQVVKKTNKDTKRGHLTVKYEEHQSEKGKHTIAEKAVEQENVTVVKLEAVDGQKQDDGNSQGSGKKKVKWEPVKWKEQLNNVREMRKSRDAPVDTMGCDRISDEKASPEV